MNRKSVYIRPEYWVVEIVSDACLMEASGTAGATGGDMPWGAREGSVYDFNDEEGDDGKIVW